MAVCRSEGGDIPRPCLTDIGQADPSPGERLLSEPFHEEVRHEPGGAAVAVRERMHGDETVMQPHRDLIRRIGLLLDPVANIVQRHAELDRNTDRIDPDIALGPAEVAGPGPDIAEHPAVELPDECFGEDVPAALAVCPCGARSDVGLLGLVQLASVGDPGLKKTVPFLRFKRRGVVGLVE